MVYAENYQQYRDAGWESVLPLAPCTKFPPPRQYTGYAALVPSFADCYAWAEENPNGNICLRLPDGVVGIDVDAYGAKTGAATFAHAQRIWGVLPDTWISTSRDDGTSGIRLYRVPSGTRLETIITFPERGWGNIEVVQYFHRYAVCAPSIHPETGVAYRWLNPAGVVSDTVPSADELPELPEKWLTSLTATVDTSAVSVSANVADALDAMPKGLPDKAVQERVNQAIQDLLSSPGSRHDATLKNVLALLRLAEQGHPGVPAGLHAVRDVFVRVIGPERGVDAAQGEWDRIVGGQRGHDLIASSPSPDPAAENAELLWLMGLTDEFWDNRKSLRRIRDFAHARWCSPWAVLGCVLCRVAVSVPRWVYLPPLRGGKPGASLNLMVILCGIPGAGKDTANDAAAELFPVPETLVFDAGGLGSGEGVARAYGAFTEQVVSAPDEKPVVRAQVWNWVNDRHAVMFFDSEIERLRAHAERGGASVIPVLCAAVMGQGQRTAWADKAKCPPVNRLTYRFAYTVGAQPEKAGWIIESGDTGLPQRFLWLPATDPTIPTVPPNDPGIFPVFNWPGPWEVTLTVPDRVKEIVATEALSSARGTPITPAHHTLTRMKVAYLLHVLECVENDRVDLESLSGFDENDWELAGLVMARSGITLQEVESAVQHKALHENEARGRSEGRRQVAAEAVVEESVRDKVAQRIRSGLMNKPDGLTANDCRRLFMSGASGKAKRSLVPDVLTELCTNGEVSQDDTGRYRLIPSDE